MAKQDPHPGTWFKRLSDGCSGVLDFKLVNPGILNACQIHDCDYWWGGPTREMKLAADTALYKNTADAGWLGHFLAPIRYRGVRRFTYNEPPRRGSLAGPPERRYETMFQALKNGKSRIEAWNWAGPGRGPHAGLPAQGSKEHPQLLPIQQQKP